MTPSPDNEQNLERLIHRTLRELPSRRAPHSLEERVLAEIERRAALPWWRRSFRQWPLAARAAFFAVSAGVARLAVLGVVWAMAGFGRTPVREVFATPVTWFERGSALVHAVADFFEIILRNIPSLWLYGGLAFIGAMYFALFGIGAAAYRTLHTRQ